MVALIANNLELINDACKKHHVSSLYLIGSAATGYDFNDNSDVDFLYRFNRQEIPELDYGDYYFELLFNLEKILNRKVDLVPEEKLSNPYFIERINRTKLKLYEY